MRHPFIQSILAICLFAVIDSSAGEFKADLVQSVAGMTLNGKMFMKGSKTRMEINMGGQSAVTIVDGEAGTATVLMPAQKMAMKLPASGDNAGWSDSDEALAKLGATRVKLDAATLEGFDCEKYSITFSDETKGTIIQWFSTELEAPIRVEYESPQGRIIYELKNIVQATVPENLFGIPADYQLLDPAAMGMPAGMPPTAPAGK